MIILLLNFAEIYTSLHFIFEVLRFWRFENSPGNDSLVVTPWSEGGVAQGLTSQINFILETSTENFKMSSSFLKNSSFFTFLDDWVLCISPTKAVFVGNDSAGGEPEEEAIVNEVFLSFLRGIEDIGRNVLDF